MINPDLFEDSFSHWNAARNNRRRNEAVHIGRSLRDPSLYTSGYSRTTPIHTNHGVQIDDLTFYAKENASNHRTERYELVQDHKVAVLRRSASFYMALTTRDRQADLLNKDDITLIFEFNRDASLSDGTKVELLLDMKRHTLEGGPSQWDAVVYKVQGNSIILEVWIGSNAPVGIWMCKVETSYKPRALWSTSRSVTAGKSAYHHPEPIYVIFNPYSKEDAVYMPMERDCYECVQNDVGKVWKGTYDNYRGRPWIYGQFDDAVLPACCFILDKSPLGNADRGSPALVSRAISAMVNSVDDGGILMGKWVMPYDDGVAPWEWSGSVAIIEKYMETKGRLPVRYGQCWVFSALTVTICRALGLPCR